MENSFKRLAFLIKDFEVQCSFWGLWTKSRVKSNDYKSASDQASELFQDFVEYWQGKTGNPMTFVGSVIDVQPFKGSYFVWLDNEVNDISDNSEELDLIWYSQKFKEIYFKLRGYLNG
jgi:hypothetical protein